jgi:DNA repair exonuclease SbcCD ATPase subunit
LIEFRYAFNGKDDPPIAVVLCSDGLDGSLRTKENVQDFYEQIIGLCLDGDDVNSELEGYLPSLSETGNKDDISLAGIVDLSCVDQAVIRHKMELKKRARSIQSDYRSKKAEIEAIDTRIESLKLKYERAKDNRFVKQTELDDMRQIIKSREIEVLDLDKSVNALRKEIEELRADLKRKKNEFEDWKFTVKNEMAELETTQSQVSSDANQDTNTDYTDW